MWFSKSYRRHLCDMHINDWDESFLRDFSPEVYVENLKKAKISSAMIYFQSHAGLCYYPTKNGVMHNNFKGKEDLIKRTVDLCHKEGIDVIGYYSLIYNTAEHDRHPEWKLVDEGKNSWRGYGLVNPDPLPSHAKAARYGHCCPNNPEYRQFVVEQIKEMSEYFQVEGMFYDMPFWVYHCHCDHCKARFDKEVGGDIPKVNFKDDRYLAYLQKQRDWMGEFTKLVYDKTKEYFGKDCSVEQNFAEGALPVNRGCAEEVNDACDYSGGDLYGSEYNHSFTCKFYKNITKNQPFEYMFSRCTNLKKHTLTKSKDTMLSSAFNTLSHHGATLVIDAIDLTGTMDERVYTQLGQVFEETEKYDDKMEGKAVYDIGVYFSQVGKYSPEDDGYTNHAGTVNVCEQLVKSHILHGVTGHFSKLDGYMAIVASCLTKSDNIDNARLIEYVKNGGNLYFSTTDNKELLQELLGAETDGITEETANYISPTDNMVSFGIFTAKYPLAFEGKCPVVTKYAQDAKVLATLTKPATKQNEVKFASIHSNPPMYYTDMPVILERNYGKGKVVWSALPFEAVGEYHYRTVFSEFIMAQFGINPTLITDAPEELEALLYETDSGLQLCTTQLVEEGNAKKLCDFEISVKCLFTPKKIVRVGDGKEMEFTFCDNIASFHVDKMLVFEMYEIIK